jgi:4-oxalocrotonate tautomerase
MPFLNLKVGAVKSDALTRRLVSALLGLTHRVLGKAPELTSIAIDYVAPEDWVVGGTSLAEQRKSSFFFEIRITDETNTKEQKAAYIREVFEALGGILGNLHAVSYVHVHDVRATAYGYGGRTQEQRFHQA